MCNNLYSYQIADVMNVEGFYWINRENIVLLMLECGFDLYNPSVATRFNIKIDSARKIIEKWIRL